MLNGPRLPLRVRQKSDLVWWEIFLRITRGRIVSEKTPSAFVPIAFVATLLSSGVGVAAPAETARTDDCLSAPNSAAPLGSHW